MTQKIKINNKPKMGIGRKFEAHPTELRQDLVTGDWVVIATGRAKRPEDFANHKKTEIKEMSILECPFCNPEKTNQEKDVLMYERSDGEWSLRVFPNKYPAFSRSRVPKHREEGPYFGMDGTGYHELIVTRDHHKSIALLDTLEVAEIFDAYQSRYIELMGKKSISFIEIFHNHGGDSGASIAHPHSQLMAIPVISPYVKGELDGAEIYHKTNKDCVYCAMIEWEGEDRKRVVFENNNFIAFCPYSSRAAFEVWVMPKKHNPYFERITDKDKVELAEAMQVVLKKIHASLNDPSYNFYIHTAPCDGKDYPHFHWHIEILPRMAIWGGFELSTGIEVSTIQPEVAAEHLRKQD
jgi:UDPglucose--hexose-1-phosphate uridylyltransferase